MDLSAQAREVRTQTLRRVSHLAVRMLLLAVGPALLLNYGALVFLVPSWQTKVLGLAVLAVWAVWWVARRRSRTWPVERVVATACYSVLGFVSLPLFLLQGTSLPVVIAGIGSTLFGGFFRRRLLFQGFVATVAMLVLADLAHHFGLVRPVALGPALELLFNLSQSVVVLPAIGYIMASSLESQRLPFGHLKKISASQASTLETVVALSDHISKLVGELSGLSAEFDQAANEQHALSSLISDGMKELEGALQEEASGAGSIRDNGERIQERAIASRDRVLAVEAQLEFLGRLMQQVRESTDALSRQAGDTGEIVDTIREVNAQLLVLALNAGLEADRAGGEGRGFAVIAGELRALTDAVGGLVGEGFGRLEALREGAAQTIARAESSLEQVRERVGDLRALSASQRTMSERFAETFVRIGAVATLAEEQLANVGDVGAAMMHLKDISSGVSQAAKELTGEVARIEEAHRSLARLSERFREGEVA